MKSASPNWIISLSLLGSLAACDPAARSDVQHSDRNLNPGGKIALDDPEVELEEQVSGNEGEDDVSPHWLYCASQGVAVMIRGQTVEVPNDLLDDRVAMEGEAQDLPFTADRNGSVIYLRASNLAFRLERNAEGKIKAQMRVYAPLPESYHELDCAPNAQKASELEQLFTPSRPLPSGFGQDSSDS